MVAQSEVMPREEAFKSVIPRGFSPEGSCERLGCHYSRQDRPRRDGRL